MRINLVATGGTIGSRYINGELAISDAATAQIASVIGADTVFGDFKIHSAGVELEDLNTLRLTIEKALGNKPDAVIVTHGTDTLAFTSAYLAYAFSAARVPILLCAADCPLTDDDSNGFAVLNAAKSFISRGANGVFVLYKNSGEVPRVHHGARIVPMHLHSDYYFSIGDSSTFADTGLMRGMNFDLCGEKVLYITPYVGMNYSAFDLTGFKAVVHAPYHSGKVNVNRLNEFAAAHPNVPVFVASGKKKYAADAFVPNVTLCTGITQAALYIKVLIGLKNAVKDLRGFVLKNACGEII